MKESAGNQATQYLCLQRRVDEVCLRFERAWKAGQRPALEGAGHPCGR
jgi:hypothetical protein